MFSVQQKRDISDAIQQILRATAHPELPPADQEISFSLRVEGAQAWSFAQILNNASVENPGVNPHNELMASIPEDHARDLIKKANKIAADREAGE